MDLKQLLNSITPDIYLRLKLGVNGPTEIVLLASKKNCVCRLLLPMSKRYRKTSELATCRLKKPPVRPILTSHSLYLGRTNDFPTIWAFTENGNQRWH